MYKYITLIFSLLFCSLQGYGVELYTIVDEKCKFAQGYITQMDEKKLVITNNRSSLEIHREKIQFVIIHNTLENPYSKLVLSKSSQTHLNDVYIEGSTLPLLTGWPVKFVDNLVVFLDTKGDTHVLELYSISKLRTPKSLPKFVALNSKRLKFNFGDISNVCKPLKSHKKGILPTRILGDKIQISEFFGSFKKGFDDFTSYKERTFVYPLPYLYEKRTRMGFSFRNSNYFLTSTTHIPLYFQWSSGSEYRFQSRTQIGGKSDNLSPTTEPFTLLRTDLKSHIFHASFVGNVNALAAGTEYFTTFSEEYKKRLQGDPNLLTHNANSFNYMALMGADYGPWSFSGGTMFSNYFFQSGTSDNSIHIFREVLGAKISPVLRVMFTKPKIKFRGLISWTKLTNNNPSDLDISIDTEDSILGEINSFNLDAHFIRVGVDYKMNDDLFFSVDEIYNFADYNENSTTHGSGGFNSSSFATSFQVKHSFGDYVNLGFNLDYLTLKKSVSLATVNENTSENIFSFGGSFEFLF